MSLSSLLCAGQAPGVDTNQAPRSERRVALEVRLVQIGTRAYPDGSHLPIWAVMLGDTTRAEQTARRFTGMGPYSLNATLWTRGDDEATWVRTTYRRPASIDEALDWAENAEQFRSRQEGNGSVLPAPFVRLSAECLSGLDFIIQYDDGTAKAYLFPGTSRSAAEKFVSQVGGQERSAAGGR